MTYAENLSGAVHENPLGTDGFEFIEFAPTDYPTMLKQFGEMGFHLAGKHRSLDAYHFQQNDIHFLVNNDPTSMAQRFAKVHGPSVSAMGFRVKDAAYAFKKALRLGARAYTGERGKKILDAPAIYGIGESLIYFIDRYGATSIYPDYFKSDNKVAVREEAGLLYLDHVTHNVFKGEMDEWARFYRNLFNFHQIRYFDIRGEQTGLISRALTSPCGKIRIPLNEGTEDKSQIQEYLHLYNGEGIQHIALGAKNIYTTIPQMRLNGIQFLKVPRSYYEQIETRIPGHGEDVSNLKEQRILIDGSIEHNQGILLQIFTQNMIGPVFFEVIQRKGNQGFGEGNFRALFVAMELDQIRRGVLPDKKLA